MQGERRAMEEFRRPRNQEEADNMVNVAMELIGRVLQDNRLNLRQSVRLFNNIYALCQEYLLPCYVALKEVLQRHADTVVRVRMEALLEDNAGQGPTPNIFTLMAPLVEELKRKVGRISRLASPLNWYCTSNWGGVRGREFEPSITDLGLRVFRDKVVNYPGIRQRIQTALEEEGRDGVGHVLMSELKADDLLRN